MTQTNELLRILSHVADAYAPNTIRAYKADFEEFIRFCENFNVPALPADADTVARFVTEASQSGQRAASIRRKLVAITAVHRFRTANKKKPFPLFTAAEFG